MLTFINLFAILLGLGVLIFAASLLFFCFVLSRYEFWREDSFLRRLVLNLLIGLIFLVTIIYLSQWIPSIMDLEDNTMDVVMDVYSSDIPPRPENIPPFVLLDVDNETFLHWGEPALTPRDNLTHLIDVAVQAKARLIVVDIDVSQPIPTDKKEQLFANDQKLASYLKNYINRCQTEEDKSTCPPIIMVRALSEPATDSTPAKPRLGFLEEVVTPKAAPYVQWATAQFLFSGGVLRHWRLWEPICTENQQTKQLEPGIVPSIELLVTAMLKECTADMYAALAAIQPQDCSSNTVSSATLSICGLTLSTANQTVEQRIMYRIPWSVNDEDPKLPHTVYDNYRIPLLTILAAKDYAKASPQVSTELLTDSLVMIGGSYGLDGKSDTFETPIGDMPGAQVIINSIYSLLHNLTIKPVSYLTWYGIGVAVLFIIIITAHSYFVPKIIAKLGDWIGWTIWALGWIVIIIIVGGLFYYSLVLFEDGTWLNIAVPLVIIKIYQFFAQKTLPKGVTKIFQWCHKSPDNQVE